MWKHISITTTALLLAAAPLAAQEPPAPPPAMERLERFRLERMQKALDLSEQELEAIRRETETHHEAMRAAMAERREALESLQAELSNEPVDRSAVARVLERLEARQGAIERLRREHLERMKSRLTPEQQGRLLLFNLRFDHRLRGLIAQHRDPLGAHGPAIRGDPRGGPRGAVIRRHVVPPDDPGTRARIQQLREQIERLEARIAVLEAGVD